MSLEKIENSLKKCPDLAEIKILGWQLCINPITTLNMCLCPSCLYSVLLDYQ